MIKEVQYLVRLKFKRCSLRFGTPPCEGIGEKCYNTLKTCKSLKDFSPIDDNYTFCYQGSDFLKTDLVNYLPYVTRLDILPCEITESIPVHNRIKINLRDDVYKDTPKEDPYGRKADGYFFKKFIARHYIRGIEVMVYKKEAREERKIFEGIIENFDYQNGELKIEVVDIFKNLEKEIPPTINAYLVSAISPIDNYIIVSDPSFFDPRGGYILIDEEIIKYNGISGNALINCERGQGGSVPANHDAGAKIGLVKYFPLANPFDTFLAILREVGVSDDKINLESFNRAKTFYNDLPIKTFITEPTPANDLLAEISDFLNCRYFLDEDFKVKIIRFLPNRPPFLANITDNEIIINSTFLESRKMFVGIYLYYDLRNYLKVDKENCKRLEIAKNLDEERAGNTEKKEIISRWHKWEDYPEPDIQSYMRGTVNRLMVFNPCFLYKFESNQDYKVGEIYNFRSDDFLSNEGGIRLYKGTIIKKEEGDVVNLYEALLFPMRIAYFAPANTPSYPNANDEQKEYGFFSDKGGYIERDYGYCFW